MTDILVRLTDAQVANLLELAGDLRAYFARKDGFHERVRRKRAPPRLDETMLGQLRQVDGDAIAAATIARDVLGLPGRMSPYDGAVIGIHMRSLGWQGPKVLYIDGKQVKGYTR